MSDAVLEVGPATVRVRPTCRTSVSTEMITAALAGIDDRTVLLEDRPIAVGQLWERIIAEVVEQPCASVTLIYPSWWAPRRVERVVAAARTAAIEVLAVRRSTAIAADEPATVVEIADDLVAVCSSTAQAVVFARDDDLAEAVDVIVRCSGTTVLIDAPDGVAGAQEYARRMTAALRQRGVNTQLASIRDVPSSASAEVTTSRPSRRWRGPAFACASLVVTVCAIALTAKGTGSPEPVFGAVSVVEGRIAFQIPTHWTVTRITAGPGSRRVQASSPTESDVALHVTQSYSPGEVLERTAVVLRQAVDEQPRGVFVDFNPADRRGGRPAVTYREVRIGRDIRWTVVLDGATRISVGCQSAPGREALVTQACEKAIESAHEFAGTNRRP